MGKSFVFRDGSGNVAGYLQQAGEHLRCRIREDLGEKNCELLVVNSDESIEIRNLNTDQTEFEWDKTNGAVAGGCIVQEGKILADTGGNARQSVRRIQKKCAKKDTSQDIKADTAESLTYGNCKSNFRRWPSNPCCLKVYKNENSARISTSSRC